MNIEQIEYFMSLAKLGSFRRTAEAHYVSQPAVSKQISALEQEWSIKLFDRGYRKATLTESGAIMYESLSKCRVEFSAALYAARLKDNKNICELHVGVPEGCDFQNLAIVLSDFQQQHPEVLLKVSYAPLNSLIPQSEDGEFDVVINYDFCIRTLPFLNTKRLARRRNYIIIPKEKVPEKIEDFKNVCLLIPSNNLNILNRDYCVYVCNGLGYSPGKIEHLPNVESVIMGVKMGFGYAILDTLLIIPEHPGLTWIPTNTYFDVLFAWHRESKNPYVKTLVQEVSHNLKLPSE